MSTSPAMNPSMAVYLAVWKEMLGTILGWSEEQTLSWASRFFEFMTDPDDIFYHGEPEYWAVGELIPDDLRQHLSPLDLVGLRSRIISAFYEGGSLYLSPGANWQAIGLRVERILGEYGACLPRHAA